MSNNKQNSVNWKKLFLIILAIGVIILNTMAQLNLVNL
jgi:uncharacterized protein YpmS